MFGIINWFKYKGWFIFDLPYFIRERKFTKGIELGAKAGRSMYYMLKANPNLHLIGVDRWEIIEGGAYKNNNKNEQRCSIKLRQFGTRAELIKADAFELAVSISDQSLNFIYYDLNCKPMVSMHKELIEKWLPKIEKGGLLIGRDFRQFRTELFALGFAEEDIHPCKIGDRFSERLEFIVIQ